MDELSLANRVSFKTVQDIHFRKHASIACTRCEGTSVGLRAYLGLEDLEDVFPRFAAHDTYDEVTSMDATFTSLVRFDGVYNALTGERYGDGMERGRD